MSSNYPLLTSKITPPSSPRHQIKRDKLMKDFPETRKRFTLISAPAGYGKTMLACQLLADIEHKAWLSLDSADNDPVRFWSYFLSALQQADRKLGQAAYAVLNSSPFSHDNANESEFPQEGALILLLNQLSEISEPITLVLDDYHLLKDEQIQKGMAFLVENLVGTSLNLVVTTRSDPPLPLARWRVKGWMAEIRQEDLRFSLSDAEKFFVAQSVLELPKEELCQLVERTEGWAAGLQIALIALKGKQGDERTEAVANFVGSNRFLLDYLTEEIIEQQPQRIRDFLLRSSILDHLKPTLCAEVTGLADSHKILKDLEKHNLFLIPCDGEETCYRYHSLIAELLQHHLRNIYGDDVAKLHLKASMWLEVNGYAMQSIHHAVKAKAFSRAAKLLEDHAENLFNMGQQKTLSNWIQQIPEEFIKERPTVSVFQSMLLFLSGRIREAEATLDQLDPCEPNDTEGMISAVRSFISLFSGDYTAMAKYAGQALTLLPDRKSLWRSGVSAIMGDVHALRADMVSAQETYIHALAESRRAGDYFFALMTGFKLVRCLFYQGKLRRADDLCAELLQEAQERGFADTARSGNIWIIRGLVAREWHQLDDALERVKKGLKAIERENTMLVTGWGYVCLASVHYSRREMEEAFRALRHADNCARIGEIPYVENMVTAWKARLWVDPNNRDSGSISKAYNLLVNRNLNLEEVEVFRIDEYLALAHVLIARGEGAQAEELLMKLERLADRASMTYIGVRVLLLRALTCVTNEEESLTHLNNALALARLEPQEKGMVGVFFDEGAPARELLKRAFQRGMHPEFIQEILRAQPSQCGSPKTGEGGQDALAEPLTERELEVLQLITSGKTNQDISKELFVSMNTVKWHIKNIFGKLEVDHRAAAAARGRELNLVN